MSRSTGTPLTSTTPGAHSPVEQANSASYSSQASSSGGSSLYSTSSSSSRQRLSSGNTSPPGTLPVPSSTAHREQRFSPTGPPYPTEEKLHFSPANRGIIQQSQDVDQLPFTERPTFPSLYRPPSERRNSSGGGGGGGGESSRKVTDTMMQSTSLAAPPASSMPQNQHGNGYRDEARGSSLRQYADEERPALAHSGQSNGQRPASKARRTSSGGSRVPSEEVGNSSHGGGGSSASDSGFDWPHGPKAPAPLSDTDEERTMGGRRSERASTSSSYFTKAAEVVAAAASKFNGGQSEQRGQGVAPQPTPHMDLAKYPPQDLLRVLAALLAQIAAANDQLRPRAAEEAKARRKGQAGGADAGLSASSSANSLSSIGRGRSDGADGSAASSVCSPHSRPTTAALGALQTPSSTLCFHARNVPSISIESYLLRILKYCPATNEVFLSLLIYFDRMSKMGVSSSASSTSALDMTSQGETERHVKTTAGSESGEEGAADPHAGMRGFAIDSYNVHRLVIAGVTVASKFFSDVFYTNSRYAKVGGLPVHELNQLELQFLLLNDFKLVIPLEEMQRYANQLLVYGGVPRSTWSTQPADGPGPPAIRHASPGPDRSAAEAVLRQQQQDVPMKEG